MALQEGCRAQRSVYGAAACARMCASALPRAARTPFADFAALMLSRLQRAARLPLRMQHESLDFASRKDVCRCRLMMLMIL